MTSNIGKLYTIGNNFLSQVWIRDRYVKIWPLLAWIHMQSLSFLYENTCQRSRHFHREQRVLFWRGDWDECIRTLNWRWGWLETAVQRREATTWPYALHAPPPSRINLYRAGDCSLPMWRLSDQRLEIATCLCLHRGGCEGFRERMRTERRERETSDKGDRKDELAGEERMTACWHCSLESMAAWGKERFRKEMRGAEASPSLSCSD